ncbi:enoyl-CoA hydratase-related protein [Oleiagrimonas sp. C23AA]|uniref:enoyl-CoA hydratase-related protein n=1 Tax=Oleiagrimonas sp. C23AA TaxID=2719047 RepID=UPI001422E647|nr:enoyl-CoA hydratase-related protein [Oleiagrimonas sp. C23AA]NII10258.1 enoyl-CoA hydratase/isomerase family protein [Oleiagrimonas sp. C23AA]
MYETETLKATRHGHLAEIILNRPDVHNAFNDVLVAELTQVLEMADQKPDIHAVMITGEGKSFCAGADTHWMRGMAQASKLENKEDSLRLARLMRVLNYLSKPTIARVNGAAYGGGIGLIACCDVAIGVQSAKFSLSEVKLGLVPAVISPYVVDAIGLRRARRLFVTGEVFNAEHAAMIGLLHEAVPDDELDDAIAKLVATMEKGGPQARRESKRLALRVAGKDERAQAKLDADNAELIARVRVDEEGQEGLSAFLEKRKPSWITEAESAEAG